MAESILGKINYFTVSSQVVVAETIIVGQVPDTYLETGGNYGQKSTNSGINGLAE